MTSLAAQEMHRQLQGSCEFCEQQTLMLRDSDRIQLKDLALYNPIGRLALTVTHRFEEMLHVYSKFGKRRGGEFRKDRCLSDCCLHIIVSPEQAILATRRARWNNLSPARAIAGRKNCITEDFKDSRHFIAPKKNTLCKLT